MSNPQDPNFQQEPAAPQQPEAPAAPPYPADQPPAYAAPQQYAAAPVTNPTNTMAIISMISSIVGWFTFGVLCILGVILGHISLKKIKTSGEGGRGMALTGVILGYIGIVGWIIGAIVTIAFISVLGASISAAELSYAE